MSIVRVEMFAVQTSSPKKIRMGDTNHMSDKYKTALKELLPLVGDLGWEYERMSRSGQETLDSIDKVFENLNA